MDDRLVRATLYVGLHRPAHACSDAPPATAIPMDVMLPERGEHSNQHAVQAAREQGAVGAVYKSAAHVPLSLAEPPTTPAPESAPSPPSPGSSRGASAAASFPRSCHSRPTRVSRQAVSVPRAAASYSLARHIDVSGGSGPRERARGRWGVRMLWVVL
jgi:hypothetical protein